MWIMSFHNDHVDCYAVDILEAIADYPTFKHIRTALMVWKPDTQGAYYWFVVDSSTHASKSAGIAFPYCM